MLLGAVNAYNDEVGKGKHTNKWIIFTNRTSVQRETNALDNYWWSNYGEGSSREHAAMTPRF